MRGQFANMYKKVSMCSFLTISQKSHLLIFSRVILVNFFKSIQDALGSVVVTEDDGKQPQCLSMGLLK